MSKVLITGNRQKDLCGALVPLLEAKGYQCTCVSRSTGYDFEKDEGVISKVVRLAEEHDIFINMYANFFFKASILTQRVYTNWLDKKLPNKRMITVGSTTDRVKGGKTKLYHYEKTVLRELSSGLALIGVWENGPKVTHISFGTLDNRAEKHKDRRCLPLGSAAQYIAWILEQPSDININEISIDPVQIK